MNLKRNPGKSLIDLLKEFHKLFLYNFSLTTLEQTFVGSSKGFFLGNL